MQKEGTHTHTHARACARTSAHWHSRSERSVGFWAQWACMRCVCPAQVTSKSFAFAGKHKLPFFFVSASDGTNVVKIFQMAIRSAIQWKAAPKEDFYQEVGGTHTHTHTHRDREGERSARAHTHTHTHTHKNTNRHAHAQTVRNQNQAPAQGTDACRVCVCVCVYRSSTC